MTTSPAQIMISLPSKLSPIGHNPPNNFLSLFSAKMYTTLSKICGSGSDSTLSAKSSTSSNQAYTYKPSLPNVWSSNQILDKVTLSLSYSISSLSISDSQQLFGTSASSKSCSKKQLSTDPSFFQKNSEQKVTSSCLFLQRKKPSPSFDNIILVFINIDRSAINRTTKI